MLMNLLLYGSYRPPSLESLLNRSALPSYMSHYFRMLIIIMVHNCFVEPVSEVTQGTAIFHVDRLVVNPFAAHSMASILGVATVLALFVFVMAHGTTYLYAPPNTIIGIALNLANCKTALRRLKGAGAYGAVDIRRKFIEAGFHDSTKRENQKYMKVSNTGIRCMAEATQPIVMRPFARLAAITVSLAIVFVLEALWRAGKMDGITAISGDTPFHYLQTLLPTSIVQLLALYHLAVDAVVRSQEPVVRLCTARGSSFLTSVGLNLVDRFIPGVLATQLKTGSVSALCLALARLVASLFTIFSASLFVTRSAPLQFATQLHIMDSFKPSLRGHDDNSDWAANSVPLILKQSMPYPDFTYEDLVFPKLSLVPSTLANGTGTKLDSNSTLVAYVDARVPALRPGMSCILYSLEAEADNLSASGIFKTADGHQLHPDCYQAIDMFQNSWVGSGGEETRVVGYVEIRSPMDSPSHHATSCWGTYVYSWAHFRIHEATATSGFIYLCNETVETVQVNTRFTFPDLRIDPLHPPAPLTDERMAHPTTIDLDISSQYEKAELDQNGVQIGSGGVLYSDPHYGLFSGFFRLLITSRYAIPLSLLSDPSKGQAVADAIRFQQTLFRAQSLHADYRTSLDTEGAMILYPGREAKTEGNVKNHTETLILNATVTGTSDQMRVFLDTASTRILQGLLGLTVLLSAAAWLIPVVFKKHAKTSPMPARSPTSVAGIMAILADSNIYEFLPPEMTSGWDVEGGEEGRSPSHGDNDDKRLERIFEGCTFRLGWKESGTSAGSLVNEGEEESVGDGLGGRVFTLIVARKTEGK